MDIFGASVQHITTWLRSSRLAVLIIALAAFATVGKTTPMAAESAPEVWLVGENKRETLRDVTGVEVVVESLRDDDLAGRDLRLDVETQLEQAGIRVLREEERLSQPGFPYLYVRVAVLHTAVASSYLLEVSVNQAVTLTRQPTLALFAPTWSVEAVGLMNPFNPARLQEAIREYVQKFILAYRAANTPDSAVMP